MLRVIALFMLAAAFSWAARADETDQFLSWDVELSDSGPVIDYFLAEKMEAVLDDANVDPGGCECEDLVEAFFASVYLDRFRAALTDFTEYSTLIDVYPTRDVSVSDVKDVSIYRNAPLLKPIRVSRTLRIGDVYLGTDKLAHLFGFGRRYYVRYLDELEQGVEEAAAVDSVIEWGVFTENTFLGKGINGIFSHADLEANFQGLQMARDLCEGATPRLAYDGNAWRLVHPVRIADYIRPTFDESFNPPLYTDELRDFVLPVLTSDYAEKALLPRVQARFAKYQNVSSSRSTAIVQDFLLTERIPSQRNLILDALKITPNHPAAPLDPRRAAGTPAIGPAGGVTGGNAVE